MNAPVATVGPSGLVLDLDLANEQAKPYDLPIDAAAWRF